MCPIYNSVAQFTFTARLPSIIDIAIYYFVNAMATVSAVVFLYGPSTKLAAISALNMDDAGNTANAAAMGMTIVITSAAAKGLQLVITRRLLRRTEAWRRR